jgi:hypothetical protein
MERGKGQGAGDLPRGTAHPAAGVRLCGRRVRLRRVACRFLQAGNRRGEGQGARGRGPASGPLSLPRRGATLRAQGSAPPRCPPIPQGHVPLPAFASCRPEGNRRGEGQGAGDPASGHCSLPRRGCDSAGAGFGSAALPANTPWPRHLPLAPCPAFASCRPGIGGARLKGQGTCLGALLTPRRGATLRAQGSAPPRCLPIPHGRVTCPLPPAPPLLPAGRE